MNVHSHASRRPSRLMWIDEMPRDWDQIRGKRVFRQVRPPKKPGDEQLSATQKYGVVPQNQFMEQEGNRVVLALSGTDDFRHIDKDDFVISLRSFQGGIERCHYDGCISPAYTILKKNLELVEGYFGYLLKCDWFVAALQVGITGIREGKNISYAEFGNIMLPFPSIRDQTQIASFLDQETVRIDSLIEKKTRFIALLKEKRAAVITHAVTKGIDPNAPMKDSRVDMRDHVPVHWDEVLGKHVFRQVRAPKKPTDEQLSATQKYGVVPQSKFMQKEGSRVVLALSGTGNFRHVDKNDFVISLRSFQGGIERCHYDGCVSPAYTVLKKTKEISEGYFSYLLKCNWFIAELNAKVTGIREGKNVSYDDFGEIILPFPPDVEQTAIASFLDHETTQIDSLIALTERSIDLLSEKRAALITAAVTGKIDVRAAA